MSVLALLATACGAPGDEDDPSGDADTEDPPTQESPTTESGNADTDEGPITLGATLPLTSPLSGLAENVRDGYLLAIEEVNAAGGVLGRELELEIEDDQFDPAQSAELTRKLINEQEITALLGTYGSGVSLTQSRVAEEEGIPHLMPFASVPEMVERDYDYIFNMYVIGSIAEAVFDAFLTEEVQPSRVAILYLDNPFTIASAEATQERFDGSEDIEIVASEVYGGDTEDFTAILTKISQQDPEVLKHHGYAGNHIAVIQAMEQIGFNPDLIMYTQTQIPFEPRTTDALGSSAQLVLGNPYWYPGMDPDFDQRFEDRFGRTPDGHEAYQGYAAVEILKTALEAAGSTEPGALRDALRETDLETVAGHFRFDERGQNVSEPTIAQLVDGSVVRVYPPEAAEAEWRGWIPFDER